MALVSVTEYKAWADLDPADTSIDAVIASMLDSASMLVETHCRRTFAKTVYTDEAIDGNNSTIVRVTNPPIDTSQSVTVKISTVGTLAASDIVVYAGSGIIQLVASTGISGFPTYTQFPKGAHNVLVSYTGGYATLPPPVSEAVKVVTAMLFSQRGRDPVLASASAGAFQRQRGLMDSASGLPVSAVGILAPFRKLIIFTAEGRGM
jgi:hypothetical protein